MALRGHATIQGSTDIPTLYNLLPGYLPMPTVPHHATLQRFPGQGAAADRQLVRAAQVPDQPAQSLLRRCRHTRQRLCLRIAAEDRRRLLVPVDVAADARRPDERALLHGAKPGRRRPECDSGAPGTGPARLACGARRPRDRNGRVLVRRARGAKTARCVRADQDRNLSDARRAHRGEGRLIHQHTAAGTVARQGGRSTRRLPLGSVVCPSPGPAAQGTVRRRPQPTRPANRRADLGLSHARRPRRRSGSQRRGPGDQRLHCGRRTPGQGLHRAQGRRLDGLRLLDLFRHHVRRRPKPLAQPAGRRASRARLGLRLAAQRPHPVQPCLGRP